MPPILTMIARIFDNEINALTEVTQARKALLRSIRSLRDHHYAEFHTADARRAMSGMFGDPAKHVSNPLFRLWKFIEDRQRNPPNTEECAAYMNVSLTQVRYLLTQRLNLYVSSRWNWHGRGSRKRGMDYNTWVGNTWTTEMINRPFPAPRGWKPKGEADD